MENHKTYIILNKNTNQVVSNINYHISFVTSKRNTVKTFASFEKARAALRGYFTRQTRCDFNQSQNPFKELNDLVITEMEMSPIKTYELEEWIASEKKSKK